MSRIHKNSGKEYIYIFLLFASAFFCVYYLPYEISSLVFPVYCILFFRSKNHALWIAFFFLLIEAPGGLFSGGDRADLFRLPIYSLTAGVSITFEQMFCFTALFKAFMLKKKFNPILFIKISIRFYAVYFFALFVISLILGISFDNLRLLYRIVTSLTLFYSIFIIFSEENDFISFFRLILPMSFIAFGLQLYSLINGHQLITIFKPDVFFAQGLIGLYDSRPIEMVHILMLSFYGSLYFVFYKNNIFSRGFLIAVNVISFTSIFITATRTWFVAFTASYVLLTILLPKSMIKMTMRYMIVLVVSVTFLFSSSLLKNQFTSAFKRISTVELLMKGDITAGGTSDRFDIQGPNVMRAFWKSTILFGAAFSDQYFAKGTGHVGYQNYLLNSGIFGLFILFGFLFSLIRTYSRIKSRIVKQNPYREAIVVILLSWMAIFIINGSTQMIGYDVGLARILLLCILLYFSGNQFQKASRWNSQGDKKLIPNKEI